MKQVNPEFATLKPLLAGGLVFALVGLLIDVRGTVTPKQYQSHPEVCQGTINSQVAISREQLAQLLTVPERDNKTRVRDILKEPYCQLPSLQIRAGVAADRDVYPLAFDPQARLVILYEGDEYAGYRFSF
ncbi:MAG: hypothetical protein SFY66_26335 [Oculatellaceae cyanobacterium bins.114]|nr:hypothetical protein [Oculatellaceae cyanobacterium bins.114]